MTPIAHAASQRDAHRRRTRGLTVPGTAQDAGIATRITDSFTNADATNLTAHVPQSGGGFWTARAGTMTIQSNVAVAGSATAEYVQTTIHSDGEVSCAFKCGAANSSFEPCILFRGSDATHYLLASFSGGGNVRLYERAGSFTTLDTTTWTPDTNWHTARVTFYDDDIRIYLDGAEVLQYTALDEIRGTDVGIRGFKSGSPADSFDDFQFTSPAGAVAPLFPAQYTRTNWADDFGAADGTNLEARGWTALNGTWTCEEGSAEQADADAPVTGYLVARDVGVADVALEMQVTLPSSGYAITGFHFRTQDIDHFIELEYNNSPAYNGHSGFGCWYYNDDGVFRPIMMRYFQPQGGATYTTRLRTRGDLIIAECVEAGLTMVGTCSLFPTATKVGLFEARDEARPNPNFYDKFVVRIS